MSPSTVDETRPTMTGLTAQEAEARLDQFGPNEPAATQHHSNLSDFWHEFTNPLVLILVIAAAASAFLGQKIDAGIIVGLLRGATGKDVTRGGDTVAIATAGVSGESVTNWRTSAT
jgi:magnesium-transporting ATPase (P-type)